MQPWQTFESILLLAAALTWAAFLLCHSWSTHRRVLLSIFAGGIAALAGLALLCSFTGLRPLIWHPANGSFGFFPNRNQTGLVLAMGGLASLALAFRGFLRKKKLGYLWTAGFLLLATALVVNQDLPSLCLFLIGSASWILWVTVPFPKQRPLGIGLAVTLLLPLLILALQYSAATTPASTRTSLPATSSRSNIQRDALPLLRDASWHGLGLANFEPLFAHSRDASKAHDRVRHPENDLLLAGIEMGWLAPLAIAAALIIFGRQHWPRRSQPDFHVRTACLVCLVLFLLDGLMNVPGHRMGAVWPLLLLIGLARETPSLETAPSGSKALFRGAGIFWAFVAIAWFASVFGLTTVPTSARAASLRKEVQVALAKGVFDQAILLSDQGLRWAPLDWQWYFQRAVAELFARPSVEPAMVDFTRARFLEPNVAEVPFAESKVWLARAPGMVFSSWFETLRRAGSSKAEYFREMLRLGKGIPVVEEEMFSLAYKDRELLVIFLDDASPTEFVQELDKLLEEDPDLLSVSKDQQRQIFKLWLRKGDAKAFEQQLDRHPAWLESAWPGLSEIRAQRGEFQKACELAIRYAPAPTLPSLTKLKPARELSRALFFSSDDFASGYALFRAQVQTEDNGAALETLASLTRHTNCPAYFHFLEANLRGSKQEWESAWKAWQRYLR